jgi:uncharacterized protein YkwD
MLRVPTSWLAVVLISFVSACGNAAQRPGVDTSNTVASAPALPEAQPAALDSPSEDADAARRLFDLANQARTQAGVPLLQLNPALSQAAGAHVAKMAAQQQLSHQFSGEPSLIQRLTADPNLHLNQAGENVVFAATVEQAHEALMHSSGHRRNLLNPAFNLAGISVVRKGELLYVTEDFGYAERPQLGEQAEEAVVHAVSQARSQAGMASLRRSSTTAARKAACSMAQTGSLDGPPLSGRRVVRYTAFSPEELPAGAAKAVDRNDVQEFSVGTCYGQRGHDAEGMYYVVLVLK